MLFLHTAFYLSKAVAKIRRIRKLTKKSLIVLQRKQSIHGQLHENSCEL